MRGLLRAFGKQHAVVGDDPYIHSHDLGKARHDAFAEAGLEFIEPAVVDDARDDLADVIGRGQGRGHHAQQFLRIISRRAAP